MKKIRLLILPLVLLFFSCEVVLDYDKGNVIIDGVTVNALAVSDTVFTATISKSYPFYRLDAIVNSDEFFRYEGAQFNQFDDFFRDSAVVKDALVELVVNDTDIYGMTYDSKTLTYNSSYIPQEGDKVVMSVQTKEFPEAKSDIHIPVSQKIKIVSWEKVYSPNYDRIVADDFYDYPGKDTVARITLRISDPANEENFYMLKVRGGATASLSDGTPYYYYNDIFTSSDIIFSDQQLVKGYRGWPAYFSNVFSDHFFNGQEYEFTVESRLRKFADGKNYVIVELQSINQEFYNYLKSTMLYRISDQDSYSEPIIIYSNVENGWGIFGGVSTDRHVVYL